MPYAICLMWVMKIWKKIVAKKFEKFQYQVYLHNLHIIGINSFYAKPV